MRLCLRFAVAGCLVGSGFVQAIFNLNGYAIAQPLQEKSAQFTAQTAQSSESPHPQASLSSVRAQLANLEALPLFLPASKGTLDSDDAQLSSTQLSRPSFAWIRDQVAARYESLAFPIEIVTQWQAYTTNDGIKYVDVVVNESRWEQLNYLRRYGFVIQFGTAARNYGYQLRIFHTGDAANRRDALSLEAQESAIVGRSIRLRGAYFCIPTAEQLPACGAFVSP